LELLVSFVLLLLVLLVSFVLLLHARDHGEVRLVCEVHTGSLETSGSTPHLTLRVRVCVYILFTPVRAVLNPKP